MSWQSQYMRKWGGGCGWKPGYTLSKDWNKQTNEYVGSGGQKRIGYKKNRLEQTEVVNV